MPLSSTADSTFDSGQGSTVYSDSQSSQQSVVLGSLADATPSAAQCVCSPPVSLGDGPVLPCSLPSVGSYQQPAKVSQPIPLGQSPCLHCLESVTGLWSVPGCADAAHGALSSQVTVGLQAGVAWVRPWKAHQMGKQKTALCLHSCSNAGRVPLGGPAGLAVIPDCCKGHRRASSVEIRPWLLAQCAASLRDGGVSPGISPLGFMQLLVRGKSDG